MPEERPVFSCESNDILICNIYNDNSETKWCVFFQQAREFLACTVGQKFPNTLFETNNLPVLN